MKTLHQKYIEKKLFESQGDYGGGDYGGGGMGDGMGYMASKSEFLKTFISPFSDVLKTIYGKGKELATSAFAVLRLAVEAVVSSIIPFLEPSYDKIFSQRDAAIKKIQSQHSEVYARTNNAFNNDVATLAFFAFPGATLGGKLLKTSINSVTNIASSVVESKNNSLTLRERSEKKRNIIESENISNEEIKNINDILDDSSDEAKKNIEIILSLMYEEVKKIADVTTLEELELIIGKERLEDLKRKISNISLEKENSSDAEQQQSKEKDENLEKIKSEVEKNLLSSVKLAAKKSAIDKIDKEFSKTQELFGSDHPVFDLVNQTKSRIQTL